MADWVCHSYNDNGMPRYVDYGLHLADTMDSRNLGLQAFVLLIVLILLCSFLLLECILGVSMPFIVLASGAGTTALFQYFSYGLQMKKHKTG